MRLWYIFIILFSKSIEITIEKIVWSGLVTGERRTISPSKNINASTSTVYGKYEIDSQANKILAGSNCVVISYAGKEYNVLPYYEYY